MTPQQAIQTVRQHYPLGLISIAGELNQFHPGEDTKAQIRLWVGGPTEKAFYGPSIRSVLQQAIDAVTPTLRSEATDIITASETPEPKEVTCEHSGVTFQTTQPANS